MSASPYACSWGAASPAVIAAMAADSWHQHLIRHGQYADWVDRGRLRPTHRQWSAYLRDVAERVAADIVADEVVGLDIEGGRWRLTLASGEPIVADGVVVAGAGPPVGVPGQLEQHHRAFDGRSYGRHERALSQRAPRAYA